MHRTSVAVVVPAVIAAVVALGCGARLKPAVPVRVASQDQAGMVNLAVLSVAPWDEFVDKLQPTFAMDEKKALASVLPSTQNISEKFLDALSARARVAPPTSAVTSTATTKTSAAAGTTDTTRTSETTEKEGPGTLTALGEPPARKASDLPGKDVLGEPLGTDAMLQHSAASALIQEVGLLNAAVRRAALRYDYVPYVVRLQVTLMPFARNEPYDAYATVSFFGGSAVTSPLRMPAAPCRDTAIKCTTAAEPVPAYSPLVIPLLVTDNIETSLHASTEDAVRQLALGLTLLTGGFAGDLDLQKLNEGLRSIVGRDFSSTLTLGRASENSLTIRLGATPQADTRYSMIPRTHNVSLVLLVPRERAADSNMVHLVARTEFIDAEKGARLSPRPQADIDRALDEILASRIIVRPEVRPMSDGGVQNEILRLNCGTVDLVASALVTAASRTVRDDQNDVQALMAYAQTNDAPGFRRYLCHLLPHWTVFYPDALWVDLINISSASRYSAAAFDLPAPTAAEIADQTVFVVDDTEAEMKVVIAGSRGLKSDRLSAVLTVQAKDSKGAPAPTTLAARRAGLNGDQLELAFPSPAAMGLSVESATQLTVAQRADSWMTADQGFAKDLKSVQYVKKPAKPVPPDPGFTLKVASDGLVPVGQTGAVDLYLDYPEPDAKTGEPKPQEVEIGILGADFALKASDPADAAARVGTTYKIKASKGARLTLAFTNLHEGQKITLSALNLKTKVKHPDLALNVLKPVATPPPEAR